MSKQGRRERAQILTNMFQAGVLQNMYAIPREALPEKYERESVYFLRRFKHRHELA